MHGFMVYQSAKILAVIFSEATKKVKEILSCFTSSLHSQQYFVFVDTVSEGQKPQPFLRSSHLLMDNIFAWLLFKTECF